MRTKYDTGGKGLSNSYKLSEYVTVTVITITIYDWVQGMDNCCHTLAKRVHKNVVKQVRNLVASNQDHGLWFCLFISSSPTVIRLLPQSVGDHVCQHF